MTKIPDVIYLQLDGGELATHCVDRINDSDVKYVRAAVDRVRAMAMFVGKANLIAGNAKSPKIYKVPDANGSIYVVGIYPPLDGRASLWCHRERPQYKSCSAGDCDHVKAVRLYLANKKE